MLLVASSLLPSAVRQPLCSPPRCPAVRVWAASYTRSVPTRRLLLLRPLLRVRDRCPSPSPHPCRCSSMAPTSARWICPRRPEPLASLQPMCPLCRSCGQAWLWSTLRMAPPPNTSVSRVGTERVGDARLSRVFSVLFSGGSLRKGARDIDRPHTGSSPVGVWDVTAQQLGLTDWGKRPKSAVWQAPFGEGVLGSVKVFHSMAPVQHWNSAGDHPNFSSAAGQREGSLSPCPAPSGCTCWLPVHLCAGAFQRWSQVVGSASQPHRGCGADSQAPSSCSE